MGQWFFQSTMTCWIWTMLHLKWLGSTVFLAPVVSWLCQLLLEVIDQSLCHWLRIKNYFFVLIFRKIQIYIRLYGFDVFLWQALWDIPEAALNHSEQFLRHFTDICEEWLWTALNRLVLFLIAQRRYQNRLNLETALNRSKPLWTNWWKWQAIARNRTKPFRAAWSYFLIEFNKKLWTA